MSEEEVALRERAKPQGRTSNVASAEDADYDKAAECWHNQLALLGSPRVYESEELLSVNLYQVEDAYFVPDSNHRVLLAHYHGSEMIDAEVKKRRSLPPAEPPPPDTIEIAQEVVRPDEPIERRLKHAQGCKQPRQDRGALEFTCRRASDSGAFEAERRAQPGGQGVVHRS